MGFQTGIDLAASPLWGVVLPAVLKDSAAQGRSAAEWDKDPAVISTEVAPSIGDLPSTEDPLSTEIAPSTGAAVGVVLLHRALAAATEEEASATWAGA